MRSWWWLPVILLLTAMVIRPVASQPHQAASRSQVVIATGQVLDTLVPMFSSETRYHAGPDLIFTRDVQRDHTGNVFPQGVEFLPSLKDGTWWLDGETMMLTWKIRPRTWHDGKPVTCTDYVFGYHVARDSLVHGQTGRGTRPLTGRIANVACPKGAGGAEIMVTWKERYPYANRRIMEFGALPRHILEPLYRANPSNLKQGPFGNEAKATIGDGAYRPVEWSRGWGRSLALEALEDHPIFGSPKIKRIILRFSGTRAMVADMLAGSIDVISRGIILSVDAALDLERQGLGRIRVFFEPSMTSEHVEFNLDHPFLQDIRVRRAIAHAVNRAQIARQLFHGRAPVSHSYLPPRHSGYTDDVQKYPYDPSRARALLAQAGFTPGPDEIMRNAAGERLSLEISTAADSPVLVQAEQLIQQQLRLVGIEITIVNFPYYVLTSEIVTRRRFKALVTRSRGLAPEIGCIYHSTNIPNEANGWSGTNYAGYKSGHMDSVCNAWSRELDEATRNELLKETTRIFARDLPALPLYNYVITAAAKVGLQNFTVPPTPDTFETWNAHKWFWQ